MMFCLLPDEVIKNGHGKKQNADPQQDKRFETSQSFAPRQQHLGEPTGIDILEAEKGVGKDILADNSLFFDHRLAEFKVVAEVGKRYITPQPKNGGQPEGKDVINGFKPEDGWDLFGFHSIHSP